MPAASLAEAIDYDTMDHGDVNRVFVADLLAAGVAAGEKATVCPGRSTRSPASSATPNRPLQDEVRHGAQHHRRKVLAAIPAVATARQPGTHFFIDH